METNNINNSIPYNEWIDVRDPNRLKQVLETLNQQFEMVLYVSQTRSKYSTAVYHNGKLLDFSGPMTGDEVIPQYIMKINVENFNRDTDSATYVIKSKTK